MVNIPTGLAINSAVEADRTPPSSFRRILATLFKQSAPGAPDTGIIAGPGTPLDVAENGAAMQYEVSAGYAITSRAGQGAYIVGTPTAVSVPTSVGHGTYARYDRIYIVQPDPELSEAGVARIDVVQGVAAASPTLPALPTGALELGRKLVPAGAANTGTDEGSAPGITNKAPTTSLRVSYTQLTDVPASFTPSAHTHTVADLTDLSTNGNAARVGGKKITVQTAATADPTVGNTTGDLLVEY